MKIHELLADSKAWMQDDDACDEHGCHVSPMSAHAVCWCLAGALARCYPTPTSCDAATNKVLRALLDRGLPGHIPTWNDEPDRTHDEVLALVRELDI